MIDISVVIPVYNVAEYIKAALDSVVHQDPPFKQIIIVDDGSTDQTPEIVATFDDPRICYRRQSNLGPGSARNLGIDLSTSEYLYFMDGDDLLETGFTAFAQNVINNSNVRPDVITISAQNFADKSGKVENTEYFSWAHPGTYDTGKDALVAALETGRFPVCPYIYIIRKNLLDETPSLRFPKIAYEDEIFAPDLLLHSGTTIISTNILYARRLRDGSIMHSPRSTRDVIGYLTAAKFWLELTTSLSGHERQLFCAKAFSFYKNAVRQAVKAHVGSEVFERMVIDCEISYSIFSKKDYYLATIHRGLAAALINRRGRRLACQAES